MSTPLTTPLQQPSSLTDTTSTKDKPLLYIDIDDTIISQCISGHFELRPGVATQIYVLIKLFSCHWLTHWKKEDIQDLWNLLHSYQLAEKVAYSDWKKVDPKNKAPYVVSRNHNFYWLEDPLSTGNLAELKEAGLLDRYIPVQPKGMFGFTRALRVLFDKAGIKNADITKAGGNPQWFNEPLTKDYFDWTYYENP